MITFVIKKKCNQTDSDKLCNNNRSSTDESTQNFDIFFRSVVGSLEGAVFKSVSTNKTDGRVLHCQKYIILKRHV